jgi:3-methyladenine DNA glycosylase AlkD
MLQTGPIVSALHALADPSYAQVSQRFFKTGAGEYGEGDVFIGLRVPQVRQLVKRFQSAPDEAILPLMDSPLHEVRLFALLWWVQSYQQARDFARRAQIHAIYLKHLGRVNNWDLVDTSCPHVCGAFALETGDTQALWHLADSPNLWHRRIAMVSCLAFIRAVELDFPFQMAHRLKDAPEDLMHKAVGWMLREAGKKDEACLCAFLDEEAAGLPRTLLRYAIERLPEPKRQAYLAIKKTR